MRKWYIIATIVVIGLAFAFGALFIASESPAPDAATTVDTEKRSFLSFFGDRFGFEEEETATATPTAATTEELRPTFRQRLALEDMIPLGSELVSGVTFTASTTATTTIESVRYVFRETGRVEDLSLETGVTKRVTNTTVPRIEEASFAVNGSGVALRYLKDDNETVATYVSPLPTDPYALSTDLSGTFLRENVWSLSWSPNTAELFYLTQGDTGAVGRITNVFGDASREIFSSPLSEWRAHRGTPSSIDVTSAPSYLAQGMSVRISGTGTSRTTLAGVRGLTVLPSPGGTRLLYSESTGLRTRLFMYDLTTREKTEFLIPTLPEKCVWADDVRAVCAVPSEIGGFVPDTWYQGSVSFSDSFWMLDGESGRVDFLFNPLDTEAREDVDAVDLSLSYDNTVLSFINKKDLRGWIADLSPWFPR
jgi:hypothetical protein